jgi:Pyruvate/2-oxoacid:ferredoxin oxidoreductase delta subunit
MAKRLSVVLSQGQSKNPAKRKLEEDIITALMFQNAIELSVVPHLYDLKPDSTGMIALQGISGDMVVISWLYSRAAHWLLDRNNIQGKQGTILLDYPDDADQDDEELLEDDVEQKDRVADQKKIPNRSIYCLDFRVTENAQEFIDEVLRIQKELSVNVVNIGLAAPETRNPLNAPAAEKTAGMEITPRPANTTALGQNGQLENPFTPANGDMPPALVNRFDDDGTRRWYPVIDYSRCTNCMECIDFCLFGVYGTDKVDTILVEIPDNCRKGCPACSRVCPENAIIFPQHKTPAIAGSLDTASGLKIDLSQLFGKPDSGKSAVEIAALERDEQLQMAGRETVGMSVGLSKRHANQPDQTRDNLDDLLDELDDMDL